MGRPASTGLALCAASGAIGRLYGAHVEVGVGAAVESRVESDDGRASEPFRSADRQPLTRAVTRDRVNMGVSGGTQRAAVQRGGAPLEIQMLGPLRLSRRGRPVALPPSRKVRALLAYLALAPKPVARGPLRELLWDVPNDPRGELRWCLSKIRGLLDERACRRVHTHGDTVQLDLSQCRVDVLDVLRAAEAGIETLSLEQLGALAASFDGEFLESLAIDDSPVFTAWLTAQRRRLRSCRTAVLEQLVTRGPDDQALVYLDTWLELAPFDQRAHECLFKALARRGEIREAEAHLTTTIDLFEREGLESTSIRTAWRAARTATGIAIQEPNEPGADTAGRGRASIAIMPFSDRSSAPQARGGAADALAHDVITRLAKLRSLFVIAQGTVFALHERGVGAEEAGRLLNVDYIVNGSTRVQGTRLTVTVELAETRSARIVWAETFNLTFDDAFVVLDEIGNRIVASIASEIETLERNRAILKPPSSLDAWGAHHRGLWHMYQLPPGRQRARPTLLRDGASPGSDVLTRLRGTLVHAFSGCLPELERPGSGHGAGVSSRGAGAHGRRARPCRPLGDGPGAHAAGAARRIDQRPHAVHRTESELRARSLLPRLRSRHCRGRPRGHQRGRLLAPPQPV